MGLNTAKIDDFAGGLNYIDPSLELESDEYSKMLDVEILGTGNGARQRRGILEFVTSAALPVASGLIGSDANRISIMKTYRLNQSSPDQIMMSSQRAGVWRLNPNATGDFNTVIAPPGGTPGEYDFIQALDSGTTEYVWMMNGVATPQKFNINTSVLSAWAGTPPNGTMMRVWKNMMVVSGVAAQPQRLYFSAIGNPESWPANNFIDIKSTDDEADAVMALEVIGENLLVFKQNSTWLMFDANTYENRRIAEIGCINRFCTARSNERVYFVAYNGVYSTDGDTIQYESKNIETVFKGTLGNLGWSAGLVTPVYTRLNMTWDNQLVLYNYSIGSTNRFLGREDAAYACQLNMRRKDKQHPWVAFGSEWKALSAFVRGNFLTHSSGQTDLTCIGVVNDYQATPQRAVDVLKVNQRGDTYGAVDVAVQGFIEKRFEVQGNENKERIRRVNAFADPYVSAATAQIGLSITPDDGGVSFGTSYQVIPSSNFVRWRPEMRGRYFVVKISLMNARVMSLEIKYRGGKEH